MLVSWYAYAAASDPDRLPYDMSFWRAGASTIGTALSAWLAHRRSFVALPVAAATAVGTVALGKLNERKHGTHVTRTWKIGSVRDKIFNRVMPIVNTVGSMALAGVAVASAIDRVRKTSATGATRIAAITYPLQTPLLQMPWYPLARKLGLYFMSFSMLGHWVEMLFCTGIKYGIFKGGYDRSNHMLWDQWLFPFPAEGTAAVLADLVLVPIKDAVQGAFGKSAEAGLIPQALALPLSVATSFLANQVVCTSVDYGTGMVANRNYELWDYRDMRFNFQGQICLQNSLFYSIIATWGVWWLLPVLERVMARAGNVVLDGALVGFGSFFIFLELLYQCIPPGGFKEE